MRVLFWTLTFWPNIGGMEVLAARLLPCLRRRGHEFLVVAPKNHTNLPDTDAFHGIPVHRLPFQSAVEPTIDHIAAVRAQVARIKRAFAADLVHVNGVGAMGFFHLTTARAHPCPCLVTLHGDWGAQGDGIVRPLLRAADWVAGCSAAILARGRALAPAIAGRSSVVHNGLDLAQAPKVTPMRAPRVLYAGRLAHDKGADRAVEAFGQVRRLVPGAHLTVAGEGPLRHDLARRVAVLGLGNAVDFKGWVHPDRVMALVNDHAVVIMPSREDSFPLAALEAGAMARPVVAARVGGIPEIVAHEQTGLLVEGDDIAGFARATARLLADPAAAARMGHAARERIEQAFPWVRHVDAYDALYRAVGQGRTVAQAAACH